MTVVTDPPHGSSAERRKLSTYKTITRHGQTKSAHRVIVEEILGRPLKEDEVVHHRNGDKSDNRPENLEVMSWAEHSRLHGNRPNPSCRKFSPEEIIEIRQKHRAGTSGKKLSKEYHCAQSTMARILRGETYRDVPDSLEEIPLKEVRDFQELGRIFLAGGLPQTDNPYLALPRQYHLAPTYEACMAYEKFISALCGEEDAIIDFLGLAGRQDMLENGLKRRSAAELVTGLPKCLKGDSSE